MKSLVNKLKKAFVHVPIVRLSEPRIGSGLEVRTPGDNYHWHGLRRGADPARPQLLWQYTLEGFGNFARRQKVHRVSPGEAFAAILPSNHEYWLPQESLSWRFFWLIVWHPYVADRLGRLFQEVSPVQKFEPGGEAVTAALAIITECQKGESADAGELEMRLFRWMIEVEREVIRRQRPVTEQMRLLDEFRAMVLRNLPRPISVTAVAEHFEMSRSAFSHHFRSRTGFTPAKFALDVRLAEAEKLLRGSERKLESIARLTGFADANHLCKAFRQQYGISPGLWRDRLESPRG